MSTDFYVAVEQWPDRAVMQACILERGYPIAIERFPATAEAETDNEGLLVKVRGQDVYLEGSFYRARAALDAPRDDERSEIAAMMGASDRHHILELNVRAGPEQFAASAYVIGALTICFDGIIFDPQSGDSGGAAMAQSMISYIPLMGGLNDDAEN